MTAYLDHNAGSPLRPEAQAALLEAFAAPGNASSVHGPGRAQRRRLEEAREAVARLAGVEPAAIVFTSGGTEANALALGGTGTARVLVSAGEHPSVLKTVPEAERLPLDSEGRLELAALEAALAAAPGPALVSVMAANNETGVLQPVAEVAALCRTAGALFHCDAVQLAGRLPLALDADLVTLSAHKLGGPQGAGALAVRDGVTLQPLLRGGGQERRRRAGTEGVALQAGFGAAATAAAAVLAGEGAHLAALRDVLETGLLALAPEAAIFGRGAERLPNTCCFALPGLRAETLVIAFDLEGVALSSGAACSSGKVEPSHVLAAMGVAPALAQGALRVSLGWSSSEVDIERFLAALKTVLARQRPASAA